MSWLDPHAAAAELPRLNRLAYWLCGSAQLADDLTQETYLRVLARPRRLLQGREFPYLARTLRNVLHDHRRAQQRRPALVSDELLADHPHTHADPELAARANEIYATLSQLPDPLRDVIVAVDVAGMTYAEAAGALDLPNGTVMSRLHRARGRIADALATESPLPPRSAR
jgi:RNA polymerase sigma-70 factor, ECF subfamily